MLIHKTDIVIVIAYVLGIAQMIAIISQINILVLIFTFGFALGLLGLYAKKGDE